MTDIRQSFAEGALSVDAATNPATVVAINGVKLPDGALFMPDAEQAPARMFSELAMRVVTRAFDWQK